MKRVITVFGSSRPGEGSEEYENARLVGKALATTGFTICNGGYGGTMEAAARGAKEASGSTIGVTTTYFNRSANRWIDKEIRSATFVERLMKLVELGDGYVVLKGGTGTLLELAAVWEFINKGIVREKPIVVVGPFWKPVVETLREELLWEGLGDCTRFVTKVKTGKECAEVLSAKLLKH